MSTQNFISNRTKDNRRNLFTSLQNGTGVLFLVFYCFYPFFVFYDYYFESPYSYLPIQLILGMAYIFLRSAHLKSNNFQLLDFFIISYYVSNIVFSFFSFQGDFKIMYGVFVRENLLPLIAYLTISRLNFSKIKDSVLFFLPLFIIILLFVAWLTFRMQDFPIASSGYLRPGGTMVLMFSDIFGVLIAIFIFKKGIIPSFFKKTITFAAILVLGSLGTLVSFVISVFIGSIQFTKLTFKKVFLLLILLAIFGGVFFFTTDKYLNDYSSYYEKTFFRPIFRGIDLVINPEEDLSFVGRTFFLRLGLEIIHEKPFTGEYLYQNRLWAHKFDAKGTGGYIHNFLSVWAEFGLLSFLLFLAILATLIFYRNRFVVKDSYEKQLFIYWSVFYITQVLFFKAYSWYSSPLILGFLSSYNFSIIFTETKRGRK